MRSKCLDLQNQENSSNLASEEEFNKVERQMPSLFKEMRDDLLSEDNCLIRELVILPGKKTCFYISKRRFYYFLEEHENLLNKFDVLENHGYIFDVSPGNTPIYRMTEEFVNLLKKI